MIEKIRWFFVGTLRRQLITGMGLFSIVIIGIFITDLTMRQQELLAEHKISQAISLSESIATSAEGWLVAKDFYGLQEIVDAQRRYPELVFAMIIDEKGMVVAHTDMNLIGRYVTDLPTNKETTIIHNTRELIDAASPVMIKEHHVGWIRIGLDRRIATARLDTIVRDSILYGIVAVIVAFLLAFLMGGYLTRRLRLIQNVVDAAQGGDKSQRAQLSGTDEAALLARQFNEMLNTIYNNERKLKESEEQYRTLLEKIKAAVVVHAPDTSILTANLLAQTLLGLSREQLLGKKSIDPTWHFIDENDKTLALENYPVNRVIATRESQKDLTIGVYRPSQKDIVWALVNADPVFDGKGNLVQVIVSFVDITDRRYIEKALAESNTKYERIAATIPVVLYDYILYPGNRNSFRYISPRSVDLLELRPDDLIEDSNLFWKMVHPDDLSRLHLEDRLVNDKSELFDSAYHKGGIFSSEVRITTPSGKTKWIQLKSRPNPSFPGKFAMWSGFMLDITERKKAEEDIQKLNEKLENKVAERTSQLEIRNKEMEEFVYSISHDLRTPLRAISGFSQVIQEDYTSTLDAKGQKYFQRITDAAQTMSDLIDDMSELTRFAMVQVNKSSVDLSALIKNLSSEIAQNYPDKDNKFLIAPEVIVQADPYLIKIAIKHLLDNALKFSVGKEHPVIEFGTLNQNDKTIYFIKDNGAGFNMEYANKLFQPFQRLHTQEEFEGKGVGLATVYRIIKKHGGSIWAEGEVEQGAVFYFTLS